MSFTVDLVLTEVPNEDVDAWKYIEELREEYYDDKSGVHPKLKQLHDKLTSIYPCLCSYADDDPDMENCPWADGPMIDNLASKMGMLAVRYSDADNVFPLILKESLALGVVVADGQNEKIYRP